MAEPTPESNLALIEELQTLVSADSYEAVDGPEFSYPAVGQAVDDEMWQYVTLALGNGVLDDGGRPYWLRKLDSDSETNSANQMILTVAEGRGTAQAVLYGFYHRLLRDMRLDFPMPVAETTYYVVLELNPLKARSPEGPISVQVYPNELNTESGRRHLGLWEVTRKPNQLLTDATITRTRIRAAPTIYVYYEEHKPDPNEQLSGSLCMVGENSSWYRVSSDDADTDGNRSWVPLTSPKWLPLTLANVRESAGHGYAPSYQKKGKKVRLRGHIQRSNGELFKQSLNSELGGWDLAKLPKEARPIHSHHEIVAVSAEANPKYAKVVVGTDGVVKAFVSDDSSWISIDGVEFDVE
ncbi:hypothetical protein [Brevibacterium sp. SMBL_HHYL_HB1]|uniref:hypothetical protein n=1 Tax=Brevibacterium sp. SMBL_HHYL_HB1 TaxID=2777556 RepID=UPI001BAA0FC1|nr:hypothetical protein [Brevibacterium sp. SMBL_HHYL_HB1]QUL79929.1 hypothetical protein IG171_03550 [Brevibacterium sp. SMBL_HHYL_HB1]